MMGVLSPIAGLGACLVGHVVVSRLAPGWPRARGVVVAVLAGLAVMARVDLGARGPEAPAAAGWGHVLAWGLAYLALAYTYVFGFFNVSETARRIRLLIELLDAGPRGLSLDEVLRVYNARMIVEARLRRMTAAGQLALRDGRYVIRRALVLSLAKGLVLIKRALLGAPSEFGAGPPRTPSRPA
jgi:hypothetical protein